MTRFNPIYPATISKIPALDLDQSDGKHSLFHHFFYFI